MALYTLYKKENMTAVRRMNGRKAIDAQDIWDWNLDKCYWKRRSL
jgi:hypothetical protein